MMTVGPKLIEVLSIYDWTTLVQYADSVGRSLSIRMRQPVIEFSE